MSTSDILAAGGIGIAMLAIVIEKKYLGALVIGGGFVGLTALILFVLIRRDRNTKK